MANPSLYATSRSVRLPICSRCLFQLRSSISPSATFRSQRLARSQSTDTLPPAPPLLAKMKADIKDAMRSKDKVRLNFLRAVIAETNQAASSKQPITDDMRLLALLKKRKAACKAAAEDAVSAGRNDLREKQEQEIEILNHYASQVQTMSASEVREVVKQIAPGTGPGPAMKRLFEPGGPLDGKTVDRTMVAEIVREESMNAGAKG